MPAFFSKYSLKIVVSFNLAICWSFCNDEEQKKNPINLHMPMSNVYMLTKVPSGFFESQNSLAISIALLMAYENGVPFLSF